MLGPDRPAAGVLPGLGPDRPAAGVLPGLPPPRALGVVVSTEDVDG